MAEAKKKFFGGKLLKCLVPTWAAKSELRPVSPEYYAEPPVRTPCTCHLKSEQRQRLLKLQSRPLRSEVPQTFNAYSRAGGGGNFLRHDPPGLIPHKPAAVHIQSYAAVAVFDPKKSVVARLHPHYPSIVRLRRLKSIDELTCEFLNYFSSVFVENIKQPVPKDPLNRPAYGRRAQRAAEENAARLRRRYGDYIRNRNDNVPHAARRLQTFLYKDFLDMWLYTRNQNNGTGDAATADDPPKLLQLEPPDEHPSDLQTVASGNSVTRPILRPVQKYRIVLTHRPKNNRGIL